MRYLLVLSLLCFVSCKNPLKVFDMGDRKVSQSIKIASEDIKKNSQESKKKADDIQNEAVKSKPDMKAINNDASAISAMQSVIISQADNLIKDSQAVLEKDKIIKEQQKTIEDQQKTIDSGNNKIYTIMGCILFLAMVYCFYSHNIWAGICCFIGVIASLAITWFVSHIGAVIGVVAVLAIGYLAHKHNKTIKDELFDTVEHFKDGYQWEHKETNNKSVNRIQSKSTQDVVKKMKKQRAKVK